MIQKSFPIPYQLRAQTGVACKFLVAITYVTLLPTAARPEGWQLSGGLLFNKKQNKKTCLFVLNNYDKQQNWSVLSHVIDTVTVTVSVGHKKMISLDTLLELFRFRPLSSPVYGSVRHRLL